MSLIYWLEENLLPCPYNKYLGVDCFGCGMQRSAVALLKGNFVESFYMYPALMPMIFMFLLLITHLIFRFKHGAKFLTYNFFIVIAIVIINFVLKLI